MTTFERRLHSVEAAVGASLTAEHVALLRADVPTFPRPVGIPFRDEVWDVTYLLELGEGKSLQQLDRTCELVADVLPPHAVPIATDHAGNFFC